jgi:hypothetical protein
LTNLRPKAFLSYSHDDKEVATRIAEALRAGGIDVWFDRWEILLGDSLVQKIFEEGLAGADAFLVLISKHSISSAWVRQELDVALIKRIEGITRIIPIILDGVQPPEQLRPLRWVDVGDDFDSALREIQMAIFKIYEKPPIGQPPDFVKDQLESVGGLSSIATAMGLAFLSTGKHEIGSEESVSPEQLKERLGLSVEETDDAIEELESLGLVKTRGYIGTRPFKHGEVIPTYALFLHFKGQGLPYDPEQDIKSVASAIVAKKKIDGNRLVDATGLSPLRLNRAVAYLKDYGIIELIQYLGTAPFDFGEAWATGPTRRFVADHCK